MIVSVHDVHPGTWREVREICERLRACGACKWSLLVVPHFHHGKRLTDCPELCQWLDEQKARGSEIVLHGYYHDEEGIPMRPGEFFWRRVYTAGEAEFLRLSRKEIWERLCKGKELLASLGWNPVGFVAPAWLFSRELFEVLRELGFRYTVSLARVWVMEEQPRPIACPVLCWSSRSGWRQFLSLYWNRWRAQIERGREVLRVSIHPPDFRYRSLQRDIEGVLRRFLEEGYSAVSYGEYVAR